MCSFLPSRPRHCHDRTSHEPHASTNQQTALDPSDRLFSSFLLDIPRLPPFALDVRTSFLRLLLTTRLCHDPRSPIHHSYSFSCCSRVQAVRGYCKSGEVPRIKLGLWYAPFIGSEFWLCLNPFPLAAGRCDLW